VSIAYAAVGLAKDIFGDLVQRTVMIVGAGKMARLAAEHLIGNGVRSILVANRSYRRADEMARDLGGRAVPFDRLFQEMETADIVIASTASPQPVILKENAQTLTRARRGRPIFFIDISVPRDVDPRVNEVDNVYVYDMDDLQGVVRAGRDERRKEMQAAETVVEQETEAFLAWMKSLEATPTIVELRRHLHEMADQELARYRARLGELTPAQEETVRQMAASLVNKLLHPPTLALKRCATQNGGGTRVKLIREIFGIDPRQTSPPIRAAMERTSRSRNATRGGTAGEVRVRTLVIGSRASRLAMWQAGWLQARLQEAGRAARIEIIHTSGDRLLDRPLASMGGKGSSSRRSRRRSSSARRHRGAQPQGSAESQPDGLAIACVPEREDPRDILVARARRVPPACGAAPSSGPAVPVAPARSGRSGTI